MYRYVLVDPATRLIIGGPSLWDGVTEWDPSADPNMLLEADAAAAGYKWPPPPAWVPDSDE